MTPRPPSPSEPRTFEADDGWRAFEVLAREQYAALCAYAYRYVTDRDTAEEIVQDVLFRVWQRRGQLADLELLPYVFRSTANAAISHLRTERATRRRDAQLANEIVGEAAPPSEPVDDLAARAREAIEALPERCRLIFLLSRDSGLTYAAIAERLSISVKTVENQMCKALRLLRLALQAYLAIPLISGATELLRKLS